MFFQRERRTESVVRGKDDAASFLRHLVFVLITAEVFLKNLFGVRFGGRVLAAVETFEIYVDQRAEFLTFEPAHLVRDFLGDECVLGPAFDRRIGAEIAGLFAERRPFAAKSDDAQ